MTVPATPGGNAVVIGIGNEFRRDDGAGPEVVARLRGQLPDDVCLLVSDGEPTRLIGEYRPPAQAAVPVTARAATGHDVSEAPRGVLYHRYELDAGGSIRSARIVPPTSQNPRAIEDDLRQFVQTRLDFDDEELTRVCEQAIRNYDPCISCSTHFLDLRVDRR